MGTAAVVLSRQGLCAARRKRSALSGFGVTAGKITFNLTEFHADCGFVTSQMTSHYCMHIVLQLFSMLMLAAWQCQQLEEFSFSAQP